MMGRASRLSIALLNALLFSAAGCTKTLVYGERSGFNLSIIADPAQSLPIQVNGGLQRRVVGIIPGSKDADENGAKGEAVNMFSRFDLDYDENSESVFRGDLTVNSAFASGAAALAIADKEQIVAALVGRKFSFDDDAEIKAAQQALINYVGPSEDNSKIYLGVAELQGLAIPTEGDVNSRAIRGVLQPTNRSANVKIARALNLLPEN